MSATAARPETSPPDPGEPPLRRADDRPPPTFRERCALLGWKVMLFGSIGAIAFFALAGFLSLVRGTPVEHVRLVGTRRDFPSVHDSSFTGLVALYTGAPLSAGNVVLPLADGVETYPALWADLRRARGSITLQNYYAKPGALADTLAAILAERARAGVRVLVILDAFGSQELIGDWSEKLEEAGVRVSVLRKMHWWQADRLATRSHVRVVVVDGEVGYTGGYGFADYWLGDGHTADAWRETNVRLTGPAVAQLQAAFGIAWAETTGELLTGSLFFPPPRPRESPTLAATLFTAPPAGSTPAERFLALSIRAARQRLWIANGYFLPDQDFRVMLCDAASDGVDVRVITPGEKTDLPFVRWASRGKWESLLACGVRIWEYQPSMMHAKTFVVDGAWVAIGSMNFDNRSLALNNESTVAALDPALGARMERLFLEDLARSREVTREAYDARPWWHRLVERLTGLASPLL